MAEKGWGRDAWMPLLLGGLAIVSLVGMMELFGKDKTMENLKKIRDALRFATDAAVPRVQAEATLALAEIAEELLVEMQHAHKDDLAENMIFAKEIDLGAKANGEIRTVLGEIRDMLRTGFGLDPPPADAEGEPTPEEAAP